MAKKTPAKPPNYKRLEKVYGIKDYEYDKLVKEQNGVCFICHRDPRQFVVKKYRHNLCVDHDHNTGAIRGLLCKHCNSMISRWLHDDVDKIKRVLKYFTRKNPKVSYHHISKDTNND